MTLRPIDLNSTRTGSDGVRVAIDGSFLALPPSGTGTYVTSLVAALHEAAPGLDLRLLEPLWDQPGPLDAPEQSRLARLQRDRRLQRARWDLNGLGRAARRMRVDLLHVPHFSAPLRAGCPLVVTIHDVIPLVLPAYRHSRAMRLHLSIVQRTVRAARVILTPSRAAAADVERVLGIDRARIRVTPEAAGLAFVPASDPSAVRETVRRLGVSHRYLFNLGGFDVRKNLPLLLEAFAHARTRLAEPVQLVIAGAPHTGNPVVFPPLAPVVRYLNLDGAVILPGRVSDEEKLALYQGAACYVTPSSYEGFGLTALEAMACGVPTIAANRTSLPEVVGAAGILVEPEREALAAAIVAVMDDPAQAADLRARGLARAATYSWARTAQLTLDVYREVIDSAPRRRSAS